MSPIFHPNRQTVVMLPSSRRSVLVVVDYSDDPAAQPSRADVLLRVCRDKLDDAIAVGEAIIDLLHAGETAQWAASRPAAGLDAAIFGGPFGRQVTAVRTPSVPGPFANHALQGRRGGPRDPASPCVKIKLPERQRPRIVPLTTDQIGVIAGRVDARYRALVLLAAATGLRSGELRGLTVDRITPALHVRTAVPARGVTLRIDRQLAGIDADGEPVFAPVKTKAADRSVPVGASIARLLAEHLAEHGPGSGGVVFSVKGGLPVDRSRAGHIWRAAAGGLELRQRSGWHDLCHHHASLLIAAG